MYTDPGLCPNVHLRLEMIRFIAMWPSTFLEDATSGQAVVKGLVNTIPYVDPVVDIRVSILYPLAKVLNTLHQYLHFFDVAEAAVHQVKNMKAGPELIFFHRLIGLFSRMAELAGFLLQKGVASAAETEVAYFKIFGAFGLLLSVSATAEAYRYPGLSQVAATSLVSVASSLVAVRGDLLLKAGGSFPRLVVSLDSIFMVLYIQSNYSPLWRVLQQNHAEVLNNIKKEAVEFGGFFHHFPELCEDSSSNYPEDFVDSVTQAVMEAPVLLHSSNMVVDESTLIHLLLVSPTDPFTRVPLDHGSYSRLPQLKDKIDSFP